MQQQDFNFIDMYLLNTLLGFAIAQLSDIFRRQKSSDASPVKFDLVFFIKDNWQKAIVSIALSFCISVAVHLNITDFSKLFGQEWTALNQIVYIVIGAVPEMVLQHFKRKIGLFQPDEIKGYKRDA